MEGDSLSGVLQQPGAGEAEAFADLYRRFYRRVLGLCRYLLGSEPDAEDAASGVFIRLRKAMKTYDRSQPFPQWLFSVTSHYCLDRLRRRRLEGRVFAPPGAEKREFAAANLSPLEELLSNEQKDAVRTAVAGLPERYRIPLVLRYYNDFTYDQIAASLGLTPSHVGILIF